MPISVLETWNEWDDINLSTPEERQKRLEILICQKLKNGEDVSQCLQVLEYLKTKTFEEHLSKLFINRLRDRLRLEAWRQAGFITLTMVVALTCCLATFKVINVLDSLKTTHHQKQGLGNGVPHEIITNTEK